VWRVKGGFVTRTKNAGADAGIRYQESDESLHKFLRASRLAIIFQGLQAYHMGLDAFI
jgi:hypothetical protein